MSFRTRLTTFFVLIVVVPMAAMSFLVFRLIDDSQSGKAQARATGLANAAANVYQSASVEASLRARSLAQALALTPESRLQQRIAALAVQDDLVRVTVDVGGRRVAATGDATAVAPGVAVVNPVAGQPARTFTVSGVTAAQYASEIAGPGVGVVVRSGSTVLASTLPAAHSLLLAPEQTAVTIGSRSYRVASESLPGFDHGRIQVSVLSDLAASGGSVAGDRVLAIVFIAGFLVLAFFFTVLSSRALGSQLSEFLAAARRLAGGDFSSPIPTAGRDEFALLGQEFNNMSDQLERRMAELDRERLRVRTAVQRIGEAFARGLDRDALLKIALETAMDATDAERGRVSARHSETDPLTETRHVGRLDGLEAPIHEAERAALAGDGVGQATADHLHFATVALGSISPGGPTHGLITVARRGQAFTDDDVELLRSLATQTTLAMANIKLHYDVQRQAVTDDLTGLVNHGRFQALLTAEMEEVRRYRYPVALIMIDIDDFKSVNDEHGHQQGDLVLRRVAEVLSEISRDVDVAARYGGEELALILPHTDVDGAYEMAERVRESIAGVEIPLLTGDGTIHVTVSAGVASTVAGEKNDLIAAADAALYEAKREGKNRVVRAASPAPEGPATPHPANVGGGE